MLKGNLVKFKVPCVAKFCDHTGTKDFIIDSNLFGVVTNCLEHPYTDQILLEIFAAGELLFDVDPADVTLMSR